jgi:tetratricopeptide (TPR) repeat protein
MIYDYLLNIDSANYYYDILIQNNAYSSNNYAEFKLAMGEFDQAELFFREAEQHDNASEKNTKEYYFMRGTLAIYRGHPENADTLLAGVLQNQGSTPGYGWHSIGLARAQHYEGLTAESQEHANKAARFQELHIGTTWGQEHYNLAVASLNYINQVQFKQEFLFEHDEWYFWLNPLNWYRWIKYTLSIRHHKMVLASLVAENPEREQVLYSLFSPENIITFDEVWSLIDGFGNEYFIDIYKKRLQNDQRPQLKKYFMYVLGKLYLAEDKDDTAIRYFEQALTAASSEDDPYETLLTARIYEGLALASGEEASNDYTRKLYNTYPQLLPFTDLTMSFRLDVKDGNTKEQQNIIKDLQTSNIDFTSSNSAPVVSLEFVPHGEVLDIVYEVTADHDVQQHGTLRIEANEKESAGKLLAYRLFRIQKARLGEQPPVPAPVAKEKIEKAV